MALKVHTRGHLVAEINVTPLTDVFLVLLESFSQRLVEAKAPNGFEVSPFFNSLIPQGLYVENFYNNSMQTSRALFIILGGVYESYKGKAFRSFVDLNLRPLPEILDGAGYRTVFFNAHDDLNFDNKGPYLRYKPSKICINSSLLIPASLAIFLRMPLPSSSPLCKGTTVVRPSVCFITRWLPCCLTG